MKKNKISAIIIAKDAKKKIKGCLQSLGWVDEIVVVDTGSVDNTKEIAKKFTDKIYSYDKGSYPDWRNYGKEKASGIYILYVDTDEVVDYNLRKEIKSRLLNWPENTACYAIPRKNIVFKKWLKHGGWYPDYVIRLFKKSMLKKWKNILHEQPEYQGELDYLKNPLIHYKENTLEEMIEKTNKWSEIEGRLMFDADHPKMNIKRFISAMFREFYFRFVIKLAFLDGGEGIIMGIYQIYSRFISYAKLWELQIQNEKKNR